MGLDKYKLIEDLVHHVDVSTDADLQRNFNSFYMVRQNEEWRNIYYDLSEQVKQSGDASFSFVLEEFYRQTRNVESTFSSKLLAMLKLEMLIWDMYVMQNLKLKVPLTSNPNRIQKIEDLYDSIVA